MRSIPTIKLSRKLITFLIISTLMYTLPFSCIDSIGIPQSSDADVLIVNQVEEIALEAKKIPFKLKMETINFEKNVKKDSTKLQNIKKDLETVIKSPKPSRSQLQVIEDRLINDTQIPEGFLDKILTPLTAAKYGSDAEIEQNIEKAIENVDDILSGNDFKRKAKAHAQAELDEEGVGLDDILKQINKDEDKVKDIVDKVTGEVGKDKDKAEENLNKRAAEMENAAANKIKEYLEELNLDKCEEDLIAKNFENIDEDTNLDMLRPAILKILKTCEANDTTETMVNDVVKVLEKAKSEVEVLNNHKNDLTEIAKQLRKAKEDMTVEERKELANQIEQNSKDFANKIDNELEELNKKQRQLQNREAQIARNEAEIRAAMNRYQCRGCKCDGMNGRLVNTNQENYEQCIKLCTESCINKAERKQIKEERKKNERKRKAMLSLKILLGLALIGLAIFFSVTVGPEVGLPFVAIAAALMFSGAGNGNGNYESGGGYEAPAVIDGNAGTPKTPPHETDENGQTPEEGQPTNSNSIPPNSNDIKSLEMQAVSGEGWEWGRCYENFAAFYNEETPKWYLAQLPESIDIYKICGANDETVWGLGTNNKTFQSKMVPIESEKDCNDPDVRAKATPPKFTESQVKCSINSEEELKICCDKQKEEKEPGDGESEPPKKKLDGVTPEEEDEPAPPKPKNRILLGDGWEIIEQDEVFVLLKDKNGRFYVSKYPTPEDNSICGVNAAAKKLMGFNKNNIFFGANLVAIEDSIEFKDTSIRSNVEIEEGKQAKCNINSGMELSDAEFKKCCTNEEEKQPSVVGLGSEPEPANSNRVVPGKDWEIVKQRGLLVLLRHSRKELYMSKFLHSENNSICGVSKDSKKLWGFDKNKIFFSADLVKINSRGEFETSDFNSIKPNTGSKAECSIEAANDLKQCCDKELKNQASVVEPNQFVEGKDWKVERTDGVYMLLLHVASDSLFMSKGLSEGGNSICGADKANKKLQGFSKDKVYFSTDLIVINNEKEFTNRNNRSRLILNEGNKVDCDISEDLKECCDKQQQQNGAKKEKPPSPQPESVAPLPSQKVFRTALDGDWEVEDASGQYVFVSHKKNNRLYLGKVKARSGLSPICGVDESEKILWGFTEKGEGFLSEMVELKNRGDISDAEIRENVDKKYQPLDKTDYKTDCDFKADLMSCCKSSQSEVKEDYKKTKEQENREQTRFKFKENLSPTAKDIEEFKIKQEKIREGKNAKQKVKPPKIEEVDPKNLPKLDAKGSIPYHESKAKKETRYKYEHDGKTYIIQFEKDDEDNYFSIWRREGNQNILAGEIPRTAPIVNLKGGKPIIDFKSICVEVTFKGDNPDYMSAIDKQGNNIVMRFIHGNEKKAITIGGKIEQCSSDKK